MTRFAKIQAIYEYILPQQPLASEQKMSDAILEHYQQVGFAVLDIEDVFLQIAFYDYEPIETLNDARKRLYRNVVGYGLIAETKIKSTPELEQEAEIIAFYSQQGVKVTNFSELLSYFPWSRAFISSTTTVAVNDTEPEHKLF